MTRQHEDIEMPTTGSGGLEERWRSLSSKVKIGLIAAFAAITLLPPFESSSGTFQRYYFIINNDDREHIAWEFFLLEIGVLYIVFWLLSSHKLSVQVRFQVAIAVATLISLVFPPYAIRGTESFTQYKFILDNGGLSSDRIYWGMLFLEWLIIAAISIITKLLYSKNDKSAINRSPDNHAE